MSAYGINPGSFEWPCVCGNGDAIRLVRHQGLATRCGWCPIGGWRTLWFVVVASGHACLLPGSHNNFLLLAAVCYNHFFDNLSHCAMTCLVCQQHGGGVRVFERDGGLWAKTLLLIEVGNADIFGSMYLVVGGFAMRSLSSTYVWVGG